MQQKNNSGSTIGIICLLVLAAAILVNGKYSPNSSEMITLQIDGIDNEVIAEKATEIINRIEGMQTVFIDVKSNLCTFRYDSGKIDLKKVESQLAGLGIKFTPVSSVKILDPQENTKKLLTVKINPASEF